MTEKQKDMLRKALERAMETSENVSIKQSSKIIEEVREPEPTPEIPEMVIVNISEPRVARWMSMITSIMRDMLHETSQGRMRYSLAYKYAGALDSIREAMYYVTYEAGELDGWEPETQVLEQMESEDFEDGCIGHLPVYRYFREWLTQGTKANDLNYR